MWVDRGEYIRRREKKSQNTHLVTFFFCLGFWNCSHVVKTMHHLSVLNIEYNPGDGLTSPHIIHHLTVLYVNEPEIPIQECNITNLIRHQTHLQPWRNRCSSATSKNSVSIGLGVASRLVCLWHMLLKFFRWLYFTNKLNWRFHKPKNWGLR